MTAKLEIAALKTRLAIAEAERDGWRAAGRAENYLAACAMAESLALRLERLQSTPPVTAAVGAAALAAAEPPGDSSDERARQMAALCISFNGRHYGYRGYRYERLHDAVNYARLERSRAVPGDAPRTEAPAEAVPQPSGSERVMMGALGIRRSGGLYCWGEYRYERLADALAYAIRALTR